jgi:hypothetical protein
VSRAVRGSFRPPHEILDGVETRWVHVRIIVKDEGRYLGMDGTEAFPLGQVLMVPGVCVATSRAELDAVIAALARLRERLPS